jgi:hypothetical protein
LNLNLYPYIIPFNLNLPLVGLRNKTNSSLTYCMDIEFRTAIEEALPHTHSITFPTKNTSSSNSNNLDFTAIVTAKEGFILTVEFQPPRCWEVLATTTTTSTTTNTTITNTCITTSSNSKATFTAATSAPANTKPPPITSFDSLHSLISHYSRLYCQSFQASIVQKLLEATTTTTTTPATK